MKRVITTVAMAAAAAWLLAIPVAAQGRGQGHPGGMGAAGSMGGSHAANASGNAGGNAGTNAAGPKSAGTLLTQNTQLSSKLSGLLPPGTDLQQAASGFKNLGQFVAAVHVSKNLNIPFDQLKCTELATKDACGTLTVPAKSSSLGQAIHTLDPSLSTSDGKAAVKQAQKQANGDIRSTQS